MLLDCCLDLSKDRMQKGKQNALPSYRQAAEEAAIDDANAKPPKRNAERMPKVMRPPEGVRIDPVTGNPIWDSRTPMDLR